MARHLRLRSPARALASGPDGKLARPRAALRAAFAIAGPDAVRVVLTGERRHADRILEGLGTVPPPEADLRVAARPGLVAVDATGGGERSLRRLARALPRQRPVDGIGCVTCLDGDGDASGAERAARLARLLRARVAVHIVVPGERARAIFVPCRDASAVDAPGLARDLRERLALDWLCAGGGSGFSRPSSDPHGRMDARIEAAVERARSRSLVLSSLALGGRGLGAAVESAWDRTVPDDRPHGWSRGGNPGWRWAGAAVLAAGAALAVLGGLGQANRAVEVERALAVLEPVLARGGADPSALAGESKARRYARAARTLAEAARPSATSPISALHPASEALRGLAARAVRDAVVHPAREVVRNRIARTLGTGSDPDEWLDRAGAVFERAGDGGANTAAAVLTAAYGGSEARWERELAPASRGLRLAAESPSEEPGSGFAETMAAWARERYANGALLDAARRVGSAREWRERLLALQALESAFRAGEARRLGAPGTDPELERILARARGLLARPIVERARAAAVRVRDDARAELDRLRLLADVSVVEIDGEEVAGLGTAARRLLALYESLAGEDLLVPPRAGGGSAEPAGGFPAREILASLERIDRRLEEARLGGSIDDAFGLEVETAALGEAARRLETASRGPLAAEERAAARAIERFARARGDTRAAERLAAARTARAAERARAALDAIEERDPLAVAFDADTDRNAVLDAVEAGIERLDALYRSGPRAADHRWRALGRSLRGYRNADPSSVLTRLAGRARDYARRGVAACRTEEPWTHGGRPPAGYPERALAAFDRRLDAVCGAAAARAVVDADSDLRSFHREHLAWRWPFSHEPGAPAVPRSTLAELLRRAAPRRVENLPPELGAVVAPWRLNRRGEPVLDLAVEWRTAPERERNAEHLVSYRIEGMAPLASGGREWRYGDRLHALLRLAKDSPLRFDGGAAEVSLPIEPERWAGTLAAGAPAATIEVEAPASGADGAVERVRVSVTFSEVRAPAEVGRPAPPVVASAAASRR